MCVHHIWRFWYQIILPCDVGKCLYWGCIKFARNSKCFFNIRFYAVFCHHCRPHKNRKIVWFSMGMSEEVVLWSALVNPQCRSLRLRAVSQYTDAGFFICYYCVQRSFVLKRGKPGHHVIGAKYAVIIHHMQNWYMKYLSYPLCCVNCDLEFV